MKLRNRTIWAVALGASACITMAQADPRPGQSAPVVQLPQDAQRVVIPTPLGGPTVTLPVRGGIVPAADGTAESAYVPAPRPKVLLPPMTDTRPLRTAEAGPVVYLPQK